MIWSMGLQLNTYLLSILMQASSLQYQDLEKVSTNWFIKMTRVQHYSTCCYWSFDPDSDQCEFPKSRSIGICIDIHQRSQTSYTTPCNGIDSHGAQIGGLRVFADHTCKNKRTHNLRALYGVLRVCLSLPSDRSWCRWRTAGILITGNTQRPPIWAPCRNQDGAGSGISGIYLWEFDNNNKCKCMYAYVRNAQIASRVNTREKLHCVSVTSADATRSTDADIYTRDQPCRSRLDWSGSVLSCSKPHYVWFEMFYFL